MGFFSSLSGVMGTLGLGGPSGVVLRHSSGKLLVEDNASTLTQAQGADPVAAQDFVTKTYGDTNYLGGGGGTLQQAYNAGNTITTALATDIEFTLSSGGFVVEGSDLVSFGAVTEVSSFSGYSSGALTLQSRDTYLLQMQANDASDKTVTLSSSNAGAGDAYISISADDKTTFTTALGESSPGWVFTQSGTGGDTVSLFIGTSDPNGTITGEPASQFRRDTGTGAEAYINISSGASGTTWAKEVNEVNHKALRDLIHFIDDGPADGFATGAYKETVTSGALTLSEIWYDDNTKAKKLVELVVTYTGVFPTTEVWKIYDTDGVTSLVTLTDTITYSGPFEDTRTRQWV